MRRLVVLPFLAVALVASACGRSPTQRTAASRTVDVGDRLDPAIAVDPGGDILVLGGRPRAGHAVRRDGVLVDPGNGSTSRIPSIPLSGEPVSLDAITAGDDVVVAVLTCDGGYDVETLAPRRGSDCGGSPPGRGFGHLRRSISQHAQPRGARSLRSRSFAVPAANRLSTLQITKRERSFSRRCTTAHGASRPAPRTEGSSVRALEDCGR